MKGEGRLRAFLSSGTHILILKTAFLTEHGHSTINGKNLSIYFFFNDSAGMPDFLVRACQVQVSHCHTVTSYI